MSDPFFVDGGHMNVLIADKFGSTGVSDLRSVGCEVVHDAGLSGDALRNAIGESNCAVLIVRGTKVTRPMLEASPHLAVVIRAGAGYNSIDVEAASERCILVANCPGKNAIAVAELTIGLMLALDRRIVDNACDLRNGVWNKSDYSKARGVSGRTLGVVGLGQIGRAVVQRAQGLGMRVCAWSRSLTPESASTLGVTRCGSVAEVAECCDVFSVHLAANAETKGFIDEQVLSKLKPGSYVINTSRAEVLDYKALARLIAERGIRAGLDVFPDEPGGGLGEFSDSIVSAEGVVYGTHHIGASTDQAQDAIAQETLRIVKEYLQSGRVLNCVNLRAESKAPHVLTVRHRNRPGVLAHTLNAISEAGVNVEEMENVICQGAKTAWAQIKLDGVLDRRVLESIRDNHEHVLSASLS